MRWPWLVTIVLMACEPEKPPVYKPSYACSARPSYAEACAPLIGEPTMQVGVMDGATFVPFDPAATNTMPLQPGPQGGYHAFLAVRTERVCPSWAMTSVRLHHPGENTVLRLQRFELSLLPVTKSSQHETGMLVFFVCPAQLAGVALAGVTLELDVTIVDCTGEETPLLEQSFSVVPMCPEHDARCESNPNDGCAAL